MSSYLSVQYKYMILGPGKTGKVWWPNTIKNCLVTKWLKHVWSNTDEAIDTTAEQAWCTYPLQTCLIRGCPNEQNIPHQTREQRKCFKFLIECLMAFKFYQTRPNTTKLDETRSNSTNQGVQTVKWTNGKCLATKHHQTLFGDQTCLATKHHQTLFGDQTFYRLDTLFGAVRSRLYFFFPSIFTLFLFSLNLHLLTILMTLPNITNKNNIVTKQYTIQL